MYKNLENLLFIYILDYYEMNESFLLWESYKINWLMLSSKISRIDIVVIKVVRNIGIKKWYG